MFQVLATGTRVFGRAFTEAWRQASATRPPSSSISSSSTLRATAGLTLQEACEILNIKQPKGGDVDMELVMDRFKTLFDKNEPGQGGSFYLQSKILRARERLEVEARDKMDRDEVMEMRTKGYRYVSVYFF